MKTFTKLFAIVLIMATGIIATSCTDTYPTYYDGGNADVQSDLITLRWDSWVGGANEYEWYQEFQLSTGPVISEDGLVVAYLQNAHGSWESLPLTTVLWTDDDVIYSEELWYSFSENGEYIVFDYRNTHPFSAQPPTSDMLVKLYIIDTYTFSIMKDKNVDIDNHDEFVKAYKEIAPDKINLDKINY